MQNNTIMIFDFDRDSENEETIYSSIINSQLESQIILNKWINKFVDMKFIESENNNLSVYIVPDRMFFYVGHKPSTLFLTCPKQQCDILIDYSISYIFPCYIRVSVIMKNRAKYLSEDYPKLEENDYLFENIRVLNLSDL